MGILKNLFPAQSKDEVRTDSERQIQEFLARGGTVQVISKKKGPTKLTANGKTSGQVFVNVHN